MMMMTAYSLPDVAIKTSMSLVKRRERERERERERTGISSSKPI